MGVRISMQSKRLKPLLLPLVGVWLAACGNPLSGQWQGTADIGPIAAWTVRVQVNAEGSGGQIAIAEDGKTWQSFSLCRVSRQDRQLELEYDAGRMGCEAQGTAPSDRRTLRGTIGESVLFGEVFRGTERLGFFRAWLTAPPSPG